MQGARWPDYRRLPAQLPPRRYAIGPAHREELMATRILTRAELHTLVWSHPPREVAHQLGVTNRELDRL